ncbi:MAG: chorismate mutase [Ruminococcus sp.]|nr:chorismate mutase [Ruminococcus sp.]
MDLNELRQGINDIDEQIEELFIRRMKLCTEVAEYKISKGLPVFQKGREDEIIRRVRSEMPEQLEGGGAVLFTTMMDISKLLQYQRIFENSKLPEWSALDLDEEAVAAVPGINGSYSHIACRRFSEKLAPRFYDSFPEVFKAVERGDAKFGVLPIVNSTAGSVGQTYELLKEYDLNICATTKVRIDHCLAARKGLTLSDIKEVRSHDQALMQCSHYLAAHGFTTASAENTSLAAEYAANSDEPVAAICSEECAREQGLEILEHSVADADKNYTRFILVSKERLVPEGADIISVSLALPHEAASLYRMLTKFSAAGLNLLMIESRPIANTDFDVVFYLDFEGSLDSKQVQLLMGELEYELSYFRFLGSYKEI